MSFYCHIHPSRPKKFHSTVTKPFVKYTTKSAKIGENAKNTAELSTNFLSTSFNSKSVRIFSQFFCRMHSTLPTTSFVPERRCFSKATITIFLPPREALSSTLSSKMVFSLSYINQKQTNIASTVHVYVSTSITSEHLQRAQNSEWSSKLLNTNFTVCSYMLRHCKGRHNVCIFLFAK